LSGGEGSNVLDWEVWDDDRPFIDLAPERRAHRWAGRSVADHIMDIQEIKTVILRQTLDNVYDNNEPTIAAQQHMIHNREAVIDKQRGGVIWTKGPGAIEQIAPVFTAKESYDMLSYMDDMAQKRIGASDKTMALDPDSMQRQTEKATDAVLSTAYTKVEYIARNMSKGGMKKMGRVLYNLTRKYESSQEFESNGQWQEVRPGTWPAKITCVVNPGLGTGSRERDVGMLQMLLGMQMTALKAAGPAAPVSLKLAIAIRETMVKIVEAANLQNPEEFFPELTQDDIKVMQQAGQQEGQNPLIEAEKVKAEATIGTAKIRAEMDMKKETLEGQLAISKVKDERERWEAEMILKREQLEIDREKVRIEAQKVGMDAGFKTRDLDLKVASTEGVGTAPDGKPINVTSEIVNIMTRLTQQIAEIEARKNAPKRVVRDRDGFIEGVEYLQ
jgi:hypothetical protein